MVQQHLCQVAVTGANLTDAKGFKHVCADGLKRNKYSEELISGHVTLSQLF